MKHCHSCGELKDRVEFNQNKTHIDGLQAHCKECVKIYHKSWYQKNKSQVQQHTKNRRQRLHEQVSAIKRLGGCVYCGERESVCLDFHHLDPTIKDGSITDMILGGKSWNTIQNEVDKCVILCSNCHRKLHGGIIQLNINAEVAEMD